MGIFHSERTQENAEQDEDDGKGNRKFAGFYTVYFEVTNILDSQNKSLVIDLDLQMNTGI